VVALKVVTMAELRLEVLMEAERTGLTVTEICRRYGISRQTYYRYRRRYLAQGLPGLEDRSRRPVHPANQIPADLEVRIVEMRKGHPRWGARRIRAELSRAGVDPPAISTIHQVLVRNGLSLSDRPVVGRQRNGSSVRSRTICGRSTPPG
jgi:transposase-like protein